MSDQDEYIYRLGLDYRDFADAANSILTLLGRVDEKVDRISPTARRVQRDLAGMLGAVEATNKASIGPKSDSGKAVRAIQRQKRELDALVTELRVAEREYQRFLEGQATGLGGGKSFDAYSSKQIEEFQRTARAVGSRGSLIPDIGKAEAETLRLRRDNEKAEKQVVAAIEREEAAVRAVTAQVERQAEARHRAYARQVEDATRADAAAAAAVTQQNQRRLAGSTASNLTGTGTANSRNSAAGRVSSIDQRDAFAAEQSQAMSAYYRAQETAQAATEKASAAMRDQYERELPRLRYALYDVSYGAAFAGAALGATGIVVLKTAADYQTAYASVRRTSDLLTRTDITPTQRESGFSFLRQDLKDLSEQIPVTFADLSEIATIGNQLGIPTANVAAFTKTVAQFSATTNVSTDEAAEAFGRLSELLNNTDYRGIGDQIAYLGVKAVATESDIIDTATQLAVSLQSLSTGTPESIKETTQATLALSTTVASLGVKPEQARGTFIRAFGAIGQAVASGGSELNDLARISGLSSDEFRQQWGEGGESAYKTFLQFTRGLGSSTADINGNLSSIGITAVRDRQTLGLLAQNGTRALDDLANAAEGADSNFLEKAYGEQAQTVQAKLVELGNTILNLFDTIGSATTGPVADALDFLQGLVGYLDDIAQSPGEAQMLALGVAVALLTAGGLLAVAMLGRFLANLIAVQQLVQTNIAGATGLRAVWAAATGAATGLTGATEGLTAANTGLAASNDAVAASQARGATGAAGAVTSASKLTKATSLLGSTLGKAGLAGAILSTVLLLPALAEGIQGIVNDLRGATPEVDDLTTAVKALGAAGADKAMSTLLGGTQAFGSRKDLTGQAKANAAVADSIAQGQPNGLLITSPYQTVTNPGNRGSQGKVSNEITAGQAAVNKLITGQETLRGQVVGAGQDFGTALKEVQNYDAAIAALFQEGDSANAIKLLGVYKEQMKGAGVNGDRAEKALTKTAIAVGVEGDQSISAAAKTKALTEAMDDGEDAATAFSSALAGIFDTNISAQKVTGDLEDLGKAAVDNGAKVAFSGNEMKTAIADIYASSDDAGVVKGRLQSLYDGLVQLGYSKESLVNLAAAIGQIPDAATDAKVNLSGFTKGVDDARSSSDEAAASIRTLSDYASDLGTGFSRAFDLRFANQTATDKITSGFRDAKDAIKDAREELRKAKADLAALNSDQATRKYQLGIATQFGDTERATKLRADIAQGAADIASKKDDIRDARSKASTALTGNSDAAIRNRGTLAGLVSNGQDLLTTMAKNGASPKALAEASDRLKKQLVDQGVQLGFSKKEVEKYASAFDDYKKIIDAIPQDISTSVTADTDPAKQAIKEYRAQLKSLDGQTVTTTVVQQAIDAADTGSVKTKAQTAADATDAARASRASVKGHRLGGYTGNGPVWQEAGVVHGQEFVLNAAATKMFPRAMLEGANHGQAPAFTRIAATATLPSGATVSLGRTERALLANGRGGSQNVSVNADRFGSAMDAAFSRSARRGEN